MADVIEPRTTHLYIPDCGIKGYRLTIAKVCNAYYTAEAANAECLRCFVEGEFAKLLGHPCCPARLDVNAGPMPPGRVPPYAVNHQFGPWPPKAEESE